MRERLEFATFKKHFIDEGRVYGHYPVYFYFDKDDCFDEVETSNLRVVFINMVCDVLLEEVSDFTIRLIEVPFETKEELEQIKDYLRLAANLHKDEVIRRVDSLDYDDTKAEAERVSCNRQEPKLSLEQLAKIKVMTRQYEAFLIQNAEKGFN